MNADVLVKFIESKKLTVSAFEDMAGCSRSSISRPLNEGRLPGAKVLFAIKKRFPDFDLGGLDSSVTVGNTQIKNNKIEHSPIQIGQMQAKADEALLQKVEHLEREVSLLREMLAAKDEIIALLKMGKTNG